MADNQKNKSFADDEVNWIALLINLARLIRKSIGIIVVCVVVGLLAGVFFYKSFPRTYEASMTVESDVLPAAEVESIIKPWQMLLEKNERASLASILNLEVTTLKKVYDIETEDIRQVGEGAETRVIFNIVAKITDVQILDTLQSAIINSLKNNPYVRKRISIEKENYELLQERIYTEIAELDSVRNAVKNILEARTNTSNTILTDPANINVQLINLYERALQLERAIQLIDDFQLIRGFTKSTLPDSPGMVTYLISGLFAGLALAGLLIVVRFIAQQMKQKAAHSVYNQ